MSDITPEQAKHLADQLEGPPIPAIVYRKVHEERVAKGERPIDYVRRHVELILAKKGAFTQEQLGEQYIDFASRYPRLFMMLFDDKFSASQLDMLLSRWETDMKGSVVEKSTAEKNKEYHLRSMGFGSDMNRAYIEPITGRLATAAASVPKAK